MKYGKKPLWKKIMNSKIVFIVLLVFFVFMARATWKMFDKTYSSKERITQAETLLASLGEREKVLSEKVSYLSTEQGIESEIRTKFRVAKDGEMVAVIVDDAKTASDTQASSIIPNISWWERLLKIIGL